MEFQETGYWILDQGLKVIPTLGDIKTTKKSGKVINSQKHNHNHKSQIKMLFVVIEGDVSQSRHVVLESFFIVSLNQSLFDTNA